MMGQQPRTESLFYYFRLEEQIPADHLLRLIDCYVDRAALFGGRLGRRAESGGGWDACGSQCQPAKPSASRAISRDRTSLTNCSGVLERTRARKSRNRCGAASDCSREGIDD